MLKIEDKYINISNTFPNGLIIDASGAGLTDGSEFAALQLNDGWEPFSQAVMSYASGVQLQNLPTGAVGVPNGVADAVGVSQMLQALQKSIGNGPGNYTLWGNELDPSVTGDRIILLAEQGLLIAVYPGLDAANWIGGNTAAQVAAIAAGQKFYRSSDAAGLVGDAAGPYIQLPAQPSPTFLKQYLGDGTDFSVASSGALSATTRITAIPYHANDGAWKLIFNINVSLIASATSGTLTLSGVTFKNVGFFLQSITMSTEINNWTKCQTNPATGQLNWTTATNTSHLRIMGHAELDSKPTWADDFEYKWGIRY